MEARGSWCAVRVLYETLISGVPEDPPSGQDVIFLVVAQDEAEAEAKGTAFAVKQNHEYENPFGETVAVRFEQVTDIHDLDKPRVASIDDGTEVYMSLEAGSDMDSLRQRGQMRPKPAK
jgi:Domain of unknown function (DUF4288)